MSNVNIIGGDVNDSKVSDRKEVHVPNSNTSTTSHNGNKLIQESNTTTYPTASVPLSQCIVINTSCRHTPIL